MEDATDTVPTAIGIIDVSTPGLEYATDAELTAIENIGVSTLEDGADTDLTAVGINNTQIVVKDEVSPPNE